jgi:UvrD-like helicase C-terminal domain
MWLFLDDNQRVYDDGLEVPKEFVRYDLTVNCRNTQAIHREVMKKYAGEIVPEVAGPEGREMELLQTDDQPGTVAALLERLCAKEEVPPQDVVVLSSHSREGSKVGRSSPGQFKFVKDPVAVGPYVRFSSIRGFKGLESPVVVLCELEDLDHESRDQQLYVGISRARNHCVLVAPAVPST